MLTSKVAVVKGKRGHEPVFRALDLVDYAAVLSGWKRVLIKVNFITTKTWDTGATTDPIVVEAIIERLKKLNYRQLLPQNCYFFPSFSAVSGNARESGDRDPINVHA